MNATELKKIALKWTPKEVKCCHIVNWQTPNNPWCATTADYKNYHLHVPVPNDIHRLAVYLHECAHVELRHIPVDITNRCWRLQQEVEAWDFVYSIFLHERVDRSKLYKCVAKCLITYIKEKNPRKFEESRNKSAVIA